MIQKIITLLFLFIVPLSGFSQSDLFSGDWVMVPEKSDQIDLFKKVQLKIEIQEKSVFIERIWGSSGRQFRDTMDLKRVQRKQYFQVNSRVFPTNVFMGMKLNDAQKKEFQFIGQDDAIHFEIIEAFPGQVSQGDFDFTQVHQFTVEPQRRILTYQISRPGRSGNPITYTFKKVGAYQACYMKMDADWTVNGGLKEKAALLSLQGIVNRNEPNLYFEYDRTWDFRFTPHVYEFLKNEHFYSFKQLSDLKEAITEFQQYLDGYIIWDHQERTSLIVAFTLAGLSNSIVIDEAAIPIVEDLGLTCTKDFRGQFSGWSDAKIYSWAKAEYWDQCSREYIVWMGGDAGAKMRPGVADWGIRNKAFFNDLSTKKSDEKEYLLADELLGEMNDMAMVFGWHSYAKDKERDHVSLTSSHGLRVEGLHTLPNMSFMSHIDVTPGFIFENNHTVLPDKTYQPEKDKVYIACVQTDCLGLGAWTRPGRGDIPYAWEVTMNWVWLAPAMMEFFYSQATPNDYFIGSLSGPGYMYPKAIPSNKLGPLLEEAERLMNLLDLRVFEVMDYSEGATVEGNTEIPKSIVRQYVNSMPESIGFINGYAPSFTFGIVKGKPFISYDYYLSPERPAADAVVDLQELASWNAQRPYYLLMHVRQWSDISRVSNIIGQLGDEYELIPLDLFLKFIQSDNTATERYLK